MAHPPSYQDATRKLDWLEIVAPYAHARDYARLCLVSKRFHRHFAPRLWNDPLTAANELLLNRDNGEYTALPFPALIITRLA